MPVPDKRVTIDDVVSEIRDGMTVGIGGWGSRRKPMAVVRALLRSPVKDLTLVAYGGPEVGMLCRAGKVRRVVYSFVSLDSIALEPHFRKARQTGAIEDEPLDEGLVHLGLQAAAWRVPFLPTRVGLGSDLLRDNPSLRTVTSPFDDGEELLAMPALRLDAAICHLNEVQRRVAGPLAKYFFNSALKLRIREARYTAVEQVAVAVSDGVVAPTAHDTVQQDAVLERLAGASGAAPPAHECGTMAAGPPRQDVKHRASLSRDGNE